MYKRKTKDVWILQGKYDGATWDDLCEYDTFKEAKEDKLSYEQNETQYPHRIISRRVKIN